MNGNEITGKSNNTVPHRSCAFCTICNICEHVRARFGKAAVTDRTILRNDFALRSSFAGVLFIRQGFAVIYTNSADGTRQSNTIVTRGGTIGETGVLYEGLFGDYLLAATDISACLIPEGYYRAALKENPRLLRDVIRSSSVNTSNFSFMSWMFQGKTVRDRIERFLAFFYVHEAKPSEESFIVPIAHATLALIVKSERATISKALGRMEKDGHLVLRPNAIVVKAGYWDDAFAGARYLVDAQQFTAVVELDI